MHLLAAMLAHIDASLRVGDGASNSKRLACSGFFIPLYRLELSRAERVGLNELFPATGEDELGTLLTLVLSSTG